MINSARQRILIEGVLLLFLLAIICFANGLHKTLFLHPAGVHTWRQSDGASYALNYYQNHQKFLEPQTHTLTGDNGHAVSEFPIIYFLAGKMYGLFGVHDWFVRLLYGLLFLCGILYSWRLSLLFMERPFMSLIPPLFFAVSPYIFYYGANFLPDVAALSMAIAGYYHFVRFFREGRFMPFLFFILFSTIAILLKVSAAILPISAAGTWAFSLIFSEPRSGGGIRRHWFITSFIFIASALIIYSWIQFAKDYNLKSHTGQNLMGLYPIWDAGFHEFLVICKSLLLRWFFALLSPASWILLIASIIIFIKFRKEIPPVLVYSTVFALVGVILFSLGWFRAFKDHDYYMVNLFALPLLLITSATYVTERILDKFITIRKFSILFFIVLCLLSSAWTSAREQHSRYEDKRYQYYNPVLWEVGPYLRSIGIDRYQKVMSVPDQSANMTLYILNNPGWTEAFNTVDYQLYWFRNQGARYLVISDPAYLQNDFYKPFLSKQVGYYKGVYIFDIRKNQ